MAHLLGGTPILDAWTFSIESGNELAMIEVIDDYSCKVTVLAGGSIGNVILLADNTLEEVRKKIKIVTWW